MRRCRTNVQEEPCAAAAGRNGKRRVRALSSDKGRGRKIVNQERFDELALALATNRVSRLQALKTFGASLLLAGLSSGCGSERDQPRSIAPRDAPPCPAERVCGTACCSPEQICLNAACASATEGVCGSDPVTAESLDAARSALEAGATDVVLSPSGCARYRRTVVGGRTAHEEVLVNGAIVLRWDHTDPQSTGQHDADRDGFFEWRSAVQRGPAGEFLRSEVGEYAPATGTLLRRETYTSTGATVHALWEEVDGTGVLRTTASFDTDPFEEAPVGGAGLRPVSENGEARADTVGPTNISTTGCSPEQDAQLKDRLRHAMNVGLTCMGHYDATSIHQKMMFHYVARDIVIKCRVLDRWAVLHYKSWLDPTQTW